MVGDAAAKYWYNNNDTGTMFRLQEPDEVVRVQRYYANMRLVLDVPAHSLRYQ